MGKENLKKENLFLRIFKGIKKGWERLGQEDIVTEDSFVRDRNIYAQLAEVKKIEAEVHKQQGFVQSARVNEYKAQENISGRGKGKNITGERVLGR